MWREALEKREHTALLDLHALGLAGGPGGVDHVRQRVGADEIRQRLGGFAGDRVAVALEGDDGGGALGQERALGFVDDDGGRRGISEEEREALGRIGGVERDVGAAGLQDAEKRDDHLDGAIDQNDDALFGRDTESTEPVREPIGVGIELGVVEGGIAALHGDGIGPGHRRAGDEMLRERAGRDRVASRCQ